MARSDNIRADIERVRGYTSEEFNGLWAPWCATWDRDLALMRERWIKDLEHALVFAEREDAACLDLVLAKEAYREAPHAANRRWRDEAIAAVRAIRAEERAERVGVRPAGDAFVSGV